MQVKEDENKTENNRRSQVKNNYFKEIDGYKEQKCSKKNMLNKLVNKFGISKRYARILLEVDSLGDNTKNNYIKNKLRFRNLGIDFENDLEKTINRTDKIIEFILNNDEDIRKDIDITYVTKEKFK